MEMNDIWNQNKISIKELEKIFNINPNDDMDGITLDGLLSDCVDPSENSMELVRSIRS